MLNAEIHGHAVAELQGNEDYLTSAVFEHLRYVPPTIFWSDLLKKALGVPDGYSRRSLWEYFGECGGLWSGFDSLAVSFWPLHPILGRPDAVLMFKGLGVRPLVLVVETKLWSGKSGSGDNDQLLRYLRLLGDLGPLQLRLDEGDILTAVRAVIYVKPSDPLSEMLETAALCSQNPSLPLQLYGIEWQDFVESAECCVAGAGGVAQLALRDVALFLKRRGLEYFKGFRSLALGSVVEGDGAFYAARPRFSGFSDVALPSVDGPNGAFYEHREA